MKLKNNHSKKKRLYHVSLAAVNNAAIFNIDEYQVILKQSLRAYQLEHGLKLYAYSMMSNYVHFIILIKGDRKINDVLNSLKKLILAKIYEILNLNPLSASLELNYKAINSVS